MIKISKETQEDFFKKCYEWIEKTYGKDNIISAVVHLDEKTPHMHVNFVPITKDGRLCAKDLFNKKLHKLQTDFYNDVAKDFGLERGETREEKRRHLSTEEYKLETKREDLKSNIITLADNERKIKEKAEELKNKNEQLQKAEKKINERANSLKKSVEGFSKHLNAFNNINSLEVQKELIGAKYKLTGTQEEMKTILEYAKKGTAYESLKEQYDKMSILYEKDKKLIPSINKRMELAKDKEELEKLKKAFERLPPDIKEQVMPAKTLSKSNHFQNDR